MKRSLVFILCLLYIVSSAGASLQLHYCMGKLAGWDLGAPASNHCQQCGMEKKAGKQHCCHDEQKWIKGATDQTANRNSIALQVPALAHAQFFAIVLPTPKAQHPTPVHRLPLTSPPKLFLLHRVFRI
ncbi:MAG: hypothetical protein KGO82_08930 [Bacteroidota bacterium]|nr:hypothetical protein [Bacteroidota bacterium]